MTRPDTADLRAAQLERWEHDAHETATELAAQRDADATELAELERQHPRLPDVVHADADPGAIPADVVARYTWLIQQ